MGENNANTGKFEDYILAHPFVGEPGNLYEAMNYIMQLGGKRVRPQLLLLAYQSVAGTLNEDVMKLALAVETFHNFSLVHDDIMDNAPVRRGQPAVHEKWDMGTAILVGDNLLIKCYDLILKTGLNNRELLLGTFTEMAAQVCEGQQMDMNLPEQVGISDADYLKMIQLKTAVLPAAALKMGALAAGCAAELAEYFYQFGLNLGMAFQLQDDYLDCFGSSAETGKQEGGDILENKKTLLYLYALTHLNKASVEELSNWYKGRVQDLQMKISRVRTLFTEAGSDVYLLQLKAEYEQKALVFLDKACSEGHARAQMMQLFDFLKARKV